MKIENPSVTLADEARNGVEEDIRSGFLDWLFQFSVDGDDGEQYALEGSIVTMNWAKGKGSAQQLPNSIYKVGKYPGMQFERHIHNPQGIFPLILWMVFLGRNCTTNPPVFHFGMVVKNPPI